MASFNVEHLTSLVPGWGIGSQLFDALDDATPGLFGYVAVALITAPAMPSEAALAAGWYQPDPNADYEFYPDGDTWMVPMGGTPAESGGAADTEGYWGNE